MTVTAVPEDLMDSLRQHLTAMSPSEQQDALLLIEKLRNAQRSSHGFLARMLDLHFEIAEPRHSRCTMLITPKVRNSSGFVHGGAIFTLIDHAMGSTVGRMIRSERGKEENFTTIEAKLNFISAIREGTLVADARIASASSRLVVLECRVTTAEDGRLVALATGSFYIIAKD